MSSKYPSESNLIKLANEEYLINGRSEKFVELEEEIIKTCYFKDICEFAISCKGADIKKIEKSLTSKKGEEYFGGFYFLAKFIKGFNHKFLERLFLDFCTNKIITEDIAFGAVDFALNFEDAEVNELFKIVLKSHLLPYEKCLIAIQFAYKHKTIDINLFKKFINWCKTKEGDKLFKAYVKKLNDKVIERELENSLNNKI